MTALKNYTDCKLLREECYLHAGFFPDIFLATTVTTKQGWGNRIGHAKIPHWQPIHLPHPKICVPLLHFHFCATQTLNKKHSSRKQEAIFPAGQGLGSAKYVFIFSSYEHTMTPCWLWVSPQRVRAFDRRMSRLCYTRPISMIQRTNFYDTKDPLTINNAFLAAVWQHFQAFHWHHAKKEAIVPRQI